MTFTDSDINTDSSYYSALIADSSRSIVNFTATNLATEGGEVELSSGGDITANVTGSHLALQDDAFWLKSNYGNAIADVSNSILTGRLDIDANMNATMTINNSDIAQAYV